MLSHRFEQTAAPLGFFKEASGATPFVNFAAPFGDSGNFHKDNNGALKVNTNQIGSEFFLRLEKSWLYERFIRT
ncbi:MAG TPA: hypothetical protein VKV96_19015 [Roseiarcus sp.]|nr:hypothetical protein [Roseiarcus sp.]